MIPSTFINGKGETICTKCNKPGPHRRCRRERDERGDLSLLELEQAAQALTQEHWNRTFTGKIALVASLPYGTLGVYSPLAETISMSEKKNARRDEKTVLQCLLHELVHWHMHTSGLPFSDGDTEFVSECLRVGAPISEAEHAQEALKEVEMAERMERFDSLLAEGR